MTTTYGLGASVRAATWHNVTTADGTIGESNEHGTIVRVPLLRLLTNDAHDMLRDMMSADGEDPDAVETLPNGETAPASVVRALLIVTNLAASLAVKERVRVGGVDAGSVQARRVWRKISVRDDGTVVAAHAVYLIDRARFGKTLPLGAGLIRDTVAEILDAVAGA